MKISSFENMTVVAPAVQWARLSGAHGYRIDGDTAHLNAMFALVDPAAHEHSWALQLWACPIAPTTAAQSWRPHRCRSDAAAHGRARRRNRTLRGQRLRDASRGRWEHVMVLVLASGRAGQFNEIHDFAVYPRREAFIQPRLTGNVGYRIDGARVANLGGAGRESAPRMEPQRHIVAGTLGVVRAVCGRTIPGTSSGRRGNRLRRRPEWRAMQPIDLAFNPPPTGTWQIVLMLREWTAAVS